MKHIHDLFWCCLETALAFLLGKRAVFFRFYLLLCGSCIKSCFLTKSCLRNIVNIKFSFCCRCKGSLKCVGESADVWIFLADTFWNKNFFLGRWNPLPYAYNVWRLSFYPLKGIWSPLVRSYKVDESLYYPMKGFSKWRNQLLLIVVMDDFLFVQRIILLDLV